MLGIFKALKDIFKPAYLSLSPSAFHQQFKSNKNAQIVDVRTSGEYSSGHIRGSVNIDINSSSFMDKIKKLDPNKTYYVHCKSGARSRMASAMMHRQGLKVVNLMGGYSSIQALFK